MLMFAGFVPDSRVAPAEVVNQVARLVSSNEHPTGFQDLLGDTDIDRLNLNIQSEAQNQFYCRATATQQCFFPPLSIQYHCQSETT